MADDDKQTKSENDLVPPPEPEPERGAAQRLREVEDEWFGPDEFRLGGEVQKGYGSKFREKLTPAQRVHHAALERAAAAEKDLTDAQVNLAKAEQAVAQTHAAVEATARDAVSAD